MRLFSISPGGFAPPDPPTPSLARRFAGSRRSGGSLARLTLGLALIGFLFSAVPASAQGDPPVGVRAAGMAGAFTAVADDATAAVWNPAGLASGSFASAAIDGSRFGQQSALFAGLGAPPLAVTYLRSAAAAEVSNGRNTLVTHNFGVSLVQSLGDSGVAVGTTLKVVHGVTSGGSGPTSRNAFDADAGVMFSGGLGQIGVAVRNIGQPSFALDSTAHGAIRLSRRVRGGMSIHVNDRTTLAADVELTKSTVSGVWRDAAVGLETHPRGSLWLRGGVHWNTAGGDPGASGAAPIAAFGASYAIHGGLMADAQASVGSAHANRGWGIGLRFAL